VLASAPEGNGADDGDFMDSRSKRLSEAVDFLANDDAEAKGIVRR
jgi:hypothetical protein